MERDKGKKRGVGPYVILTEMAHNIPIGCGGLLPGTTKDVMQTPVGHVNETRDAVCAAPARESRKETRP